MFKMAKKKEITLKEFQEHLIKLRKKGKKPSIKGKGSGKIKMLFN